MAGRLREAPLAIAPPEDVRHVLVALSGGADSVYLLCALAAGGAQVSAAHFHHGLRGASADADRDFCRQLCREMSVPFYEGGADVRACAERLGMGIESAARLLRRRFLHNLRVGVGADVVALGHHMNDQAETVLMHLLRGSGLRGAAGMAERDGELYRPLLHLTKRQIVERLEAEGVEWREDETNAVSDNPRNALRNEILPQLAEIYPGAVSALARFAQIAREDGAMLDAMAAREARRRAKRLPNGWRVEGAGALEEPLLRRVLMALTGVRDMQQVLNMSDAARRSRGRAKLAGVALESCGDDLYIIEGAYRAPEAVPLELDGATELPGLCRAVAEPSEPVPIFSGGREQVLSRAALTGAELRTRRRGDRIHPLGAPGEKSLSDYLIDRHIPRPERDLIPIVARGNDVMWVVGVGISEEARVYPGVDAVKISCEDAWSSRYEGNGGAP